MKLKVWVLAIVMAATSSLSHLAMAQGVGGVVDEDPTMLAMTTDLVFVRPVLLATTIVGGVVLLVSSPFSLGGGNFTKAADTLFLQPGKATFVRCLGCTQSGYQIRSE